MKGRRENRATSGMFLLPSSSPSSSAFVLSFSTGRACVEGGGRADGLGVRSGGGGRITLAFNPVAEGDSWDPSDIKYSYFTSKCLNWLHVWLFNNYSKLWQKIVMTRYLWHLRFDGERIHG